MQREGENCNTQELFGTEMLMRDSKGFTKIGESIVGTFLPGFFQIECFWTGQHTKTAVRFILQPGNSAVSMADLKTVGVGGCSEIED